jgi:hypothetical protein
MPEWWDRYFEIGSIGFLVMLQHFLGEGKTEIGFFVVRVVRNAGLCIGDGQSVVFKLDVGEGSIGKIDGKFGFRNSGALGCGSFDGFGIELHCLLEMVIFKFEVPFLLIFLALCEVVDHTQIIINFNQTIYDSSIIQEDRDEAFLAWYQ